jgi:hypothetical protein
MNGLSEYDESRRRFLLFLLSTGAIATLPGCAAPGEMPSELPAGKSIFKLMGDVRVNGVAATPATLIEPGDTVETGPESFVIFVVQKDSFILRANSKMTLPSRAVAAGVVSTAYTLERGKALSVMASRRTNIATPDAVIGIRGTDVYVEAEPGESYVCVCYGSTMLQSTADPRVSEEVITSHHDAPKYITGGTNPRIMPTPFKNHDDQELLLIETLVGRTTPYVVPQGIPRARTTYF